MENKNGKENAMRPANFGGNLEGPREARVMNVETFAGLKTTIETVGEFEGEYGPCVKCETPVLGLIDGIEIRGSIILGLKRDSETGKIYWVSGGRMARYLAYHNVKTYAELKGKAVTTMLTEPDNLGRRFITF